MRSGHYRQDAGGVGTWVSPLSLHPDRSSPRSLFGTFLLLASPPQDWGHVCNRALAMQGRAAGQEEQ